MALCLWVLLLIWISGISHVLLRFESRITCDKRSCNISWNTRLILFWYHIMVWKYPCHVSDWNLHHDFLPVIDCEAGFLILVTTKGTYVYFINRAWLWFYYRWNINKSLQTVKGTMMINVLMPVYVFLFPLSYLTIRHHPLTFDLWPVNLPLHCAHTPTPVIKQRMQMYGSPYSGVHDCIRTIIRTEGMRAFYRSYTTQLAMNIPFQSIHFVSYEFGQELLNPERLYHPATHVASGAAAGAIAAAITTPLDVCKTLLNTQDTYALAQRNGNAITGMANAFRTVYTLGGPWGYFRGVQARIVFQMPATAISWSVYEFFKHFITVSKNTQ